MIERFIDGITPDRTINDAWVDYIAQQKAAELQIIIEEENLKPAETETFMEMCFRKGYVSTSGLAFAQILPPVRRFGKNKNTGLIRQRVAERLSAYLDKFKNLVNSEEEEVE